MFYRYGGLEMAMSIMRVRSQIDTLVSVSSVRILRENKDSPTRPRFCTGGAEAAVSIAAVVWRADSTSVGKS